MRRAWRGIRFGLLMILGGAVVTAVIAEAIGLSGAVTLALAPPTRFVAVADRYVHVEDVKGTGWRLLCWSVEDKKMAALSQYCYEKHIIFIDEPVDPSYLHCDPPSSVPRWARLWRTEDWPKSARIGSWSATEFAEEAAVGWPMEALSIDWNAAETHQHRGGTTLPPDSTLLSRFLLWRPILPGFAADTLLWSACLAGLVVSLRLWIRARRRSRGACPACGYDLRGLAPGAVCPECGAAGAVGAA